MAKAVGVRSRAKAPAKPPAVRGWRWFLAEFAVVAAGVLAALGAQQVAQTLNWRHDAAEARVAIREEISRNAASARYSVVEDRCIGAALDRFDAWSRGGPAYAVPRLRLPALGSTAWDVAKSGQVAAHMPMEEQLGYARFYNGIDNQLSVLQAVRGAATNLVRYGGKEVLAPDEARRLREDVAEMRNILVIHSGNAQALIESARKLGVAPSPWGAESRKNVTAMCASVGVAGP